MIKKTIKYENFEGEDVTEDFYFHINKLEMAEFDLEYGGLANLAKQLTETDDAKRVYGIFKDLLLISYGKKSPDGRHFLKKDPVTGGAYRYELEGSPALGEMILELIDDPSKAAELIKGLMPARAQAEIEKAQAEGKFTIPSVEDDNAGITVSGPEVPTAPPVLEGNAEISDEDLLKMKPQEMTKEQLMRAMQLKSSQDS